MYMKKRGGSWFMKMFQKEQPASVSSPATSNNRPGSVTTLDTNKPVTPTPTNTSKPGQLGGSRRRKRRKTRKSRRK